MNRTPKSTEKETKIDQLTTEFAAPSLGSQLVRRRPPPDVANATRARETDQASLGGAARADGITTEPRTKAAAMDEVDAMEWR